MCVCVCVCVCVCGAGMLLTITAYGIKIACCRYYTEFYNATRGNVTRKECKSKSVVLDDGEFNLLSCLHSGLDYKTRVERMSLKNCTRYDTEFTMK